MFGITEVDGEKKLLIGTKTYDMCKAISDFFTDTWCVYANGIFSSHDLFEYDTHSEVIVFNEIDLSRLGIIGLKYEIEKRIEIVNDWVRKCDNIDNN